MKTTTLRLALAATLATSALALAQQPPVSPFSVGVSYVPAPKTSLKVIGTTGVTVSITTSRGEQRDQIPLVFQLPDQDDFLRVTLGGPRGESSTMKVEVRVRTQTVLQVDLKQGRAPAERASGRRFIGTVASSQGRCAVDKRWDLRADFGLAGRPVASVPLPLAQARASLELPAGHYDVRVFVVRRGGGADYLTTVPFDVPERDGWTFIHGCKGGASPATVAGIWRDGSGKAVTITQVGVGQGNLPLFTVDWPSSERGIGYLLPDGTLVASRSSGTSAVFHYAAHDGKLSGRWLVVGQFNTTPTMPINMAVEEATGGTPRVVAGRYSVNGRSANGSTYSGTLDVTARGKVFDLNWALASGARVRGVGLPQGDGALVAAWGTGATRLVTLSFEDGAASAHGRSATVGGDNVLVERLTR